MSTYIPEGHYLTLKQVAANAGVTRITAQKWIERGLLNALKVKDLGYIIAEEEYKRFSQLERPRGYPKGKPRK